MCLRELLARSGPIARSRLVGVSDRSAQVDFRYGRLNCPASPWHLSLPSRMYRCNERAGKHAWLVLDKGRACKYNVRKTAAGLMPDFQLETEGFSIVALGSFNPSIFQPFWFSQHNLMRSQEADSAKIEIIHPTATIFKTEWLSLQVTGGSFTALTEDPTKSLPIRDLVTGTFKLLEHTPLTAFGFNRFVHLRAPNVEQWHAFGHHFAPKESWLGILKDPGLLSLFMEGKREGSDDSKIQIRIEPSLRVSPGLQITINEHHDLPPKRDDPEKAEMTQVDRNKAFLSSLQNQWDEFHSYAKKAREHLLAESAIPTRAISKKRKN
jgi:hypothetical protein